MSMPAKVQTFTSIDESTGRITAAALRSVPVQRGSWRDNSFVVWAGSPIIVLRIALVIQYMIGIYFAITSFIAQPPVFAIAAPGWWNGIFALSLGVTSAVCAFAAIADRFIALERWFGAALVATLFSYVGSLTVVGFVLGDPARQAVAAVSLMAMVLPTCRSIWLLAQLGKKKAPTSPAKELSRPKH